MKKETKELLFHSLFAGCLMAIYLRLDFTDNSVHTGIFKYALILLCLSLSLFGKDKFIKGALFFTAVSDFFLLFTGYYALGLWIFSGAHILYLYKNKPETWRKLPLVLILIGSAVYLLPYRLPILYRGALFYAFCLTLNFDSALYQTYKNPRPDTVLFFAGIFLFVLCDISTAIYQLTGKWTPYGKLIWLYYGPSQYLLASHSFFKPSCPKELSHGPVPGLPHRLGKK